MWVRIGLRHRIYVLLALLVLITFLGGLIMVWYTYRMEGLLSEIIDQNLAAFNSAEELETALVNQKGFVTYYFLDGDPEWLKQLGEYRQIFRERLKEVRALGLKEKEKQALDRIESEYNQYIASKDQVIALYQAGERESGARLHKKVRDQFFKIIALCDQFKDLHQQRIEQSRRISLTQAKNLRIVAGTAMLTVLILGVLLAVVLISHVLGPIRSLVGESDEKSRSGKSDNEVMALSRRVHGLMEDIDQTHSELEKSRETLLQSEKLALVGKLAASMAHSIRNPLTSVKMRLFSLDRTLDLSATQKEDFDVISDEIRHIDTIVQHFLEFSRPPKLKMQKVSPSEVVDMTLQMLKHRLESYDVEIKLDRRQPLPEIQADPEQLKEVLVNLIVNAYEAMERSGTIEIQEQEIEAASESRMIMINLTDNGPGIPEAIKDKVFQPFYSTKEEGTGLGLSICARIIEEHGGTLELTSVEGKGTTFTIKIPVEEVNLEHGSDHR
jgi:signal transduction histidine kinase